MELTAEEWKIRYNKLKDTNSKLRAIVRRYEVGRLSTSVCVVEGGEGRGRREGICGWYFIISIFCSYEAELGRWRSGKQVPEEEQQNLTLKDISVDSLCTSPTSMSSGVLSPTHLEEQSRLNAIIEEKVKVYH